MVASSFDDIEAVTIASGQTVTFTGLQLTGEVIAFSGTAGGVETLTVNVGVGTQFTSLLTNAAADINLVQYIGTTGDESIAGGAMTETITGGTGNDLLSGGAGNDTFIFTSFATNGIDRITLGVTGSAIDDKLDLSIDVFNREATVQINKIADATLSAAVNGTLNDNVLIIKNVYCADATALAALTTTFSAIAAADVKVVVIYASSSTTDARVAVATVTDAGDISAATDVAVLVGLTVANASDYFAIGNFIL
jgi:Ca2+-binding RTX toxin-like protein